jgi:uncharacterized protein YeaO (DUF488 family)
MSLKGIEALENHLIKYGKTKSWRELGLQFNVFPDKTGEPLADAVRNVYRRLVKKGLIDKETDGLKLKSKWQSPSGEWLSSWVSNQESKFLDDFNEFKKSFLEELKSKSTKARIQPNSRTSENYLYEIAIPDFHFGKIAGMSINEQADYFYNAVVALVKKASGVPIERFLFPIGNDFFNSDTIGYTTTKGTPQRDNSHWQESFRVGWTAVVRTINFLNTIAPVDVVIVQGNHDEFKSFFLGDVLTAYFINNNTVNIDNSFESPRKYYAYKNVLIGYTHGDKEKVSDLPLIMATEAPFLWANSVHRNFHTGHLHKQETTEIQGTIIRTLPSLVGQDEWHKSMGYNSSKKAQAFIWGNNGLEGYFQVNY